MCAQVKKGGGMSINSTLTLTKMSEKMAQLILHEYSILCIMGGHRGERGALDNNGTPGKLVDGFSSTSLLDNNRDLQC